MSVQVVKRKSVAQLCVYIYIYVDTYVLYIYDMYLDENSVCISSAFLNCVALTRGWSMFGGL